MLTKNDFKLLNSNKGMEYLLRSDQIDIEETLNQLRYEAELVPLQIKLIHAQNEIVKKNKRVLVLVEGREFAGKGGAIAAFSEHLNPRAMRLVALNKPSPEQSGQWYFKRYIEQFPEPGVIAFFDRSWYNRAVVEPVNGFCTKEEYKRFMREVNSFEQMLISDGIQLIKFYFSISKKEQQRRIERVRKNPLRSWELTPVDLKAQELWGEYSKYEKALFKATHTKLSPWFHFKHDDKRIARLKAFGQLLALLGVKK